MEKNAGKSKRFRHGGLLIPALLLFTLSLPASAKMPSPDEIRSLVVRSESEICFTAQDSIFTLEIPGVEASKLQAELPHLPQGVQLQSSRRDVFFDDASGQSGTRLQLSLVFTETGSVKMPPLTLQIANRKYRLPFQPVTVYENLATLSPRLSVHFEDDYAMDKQGTLHVKAGTEMRFSVALAFSVQLVKFNWLLPKNALFREVKRFEIADGAFLGKDFSPEAHPLADFSWTPLVPGLYALPDISVTAVAYNGMKKIISLPRMAVSVEAAEPAETKEAPAAGENALALFSDAFTAPAEPLPAEGSGVTGQPDCRLLAELRSAERHSFPLGKSRAKRAAYERDFALSSPNEARLRVAELFYALFFLALVLFCLLCFQHHVKRAAVTASIAICILVACIHWTLLLLPQNAIFIGGDLRTIPEKNAASSRSEPAGERVRILETAGEWVFIRSPQASGWVEKNMIYEIR